MGGLGTRLFSILGASVLVVAESIATSAFAFDVTSCGQVVPSGEVGVVQADIDCPQDELTSVVTLEPRAQLELNGHTLNGAAAGVTCMGDAGSCRVRGPGVISGARYLGINAEIGIGRLIVDDLTLSDNEYSAVSHGGGRVVILRNVVVNGNGSAFADLPEWQEKFGAIQNVRRLELENVSGSGNLTQVFNARRIRGVNVTLGGNFGGVLGNRIVLDNATINGSVATAVHSNGGKVEISNSTLTNNDAEGAGVDIRTKRKPTLVNTTCSRSEVCQTAPVGGFCEGDGTTWNICADDF